MTSAAVNQPQKNTSCNAKNTSLELKNIKEPNNDLKSFKATVEGITRIIGDALDSPEEQSRTGSTSRYLQHHQSALVARAV
jgi:hypothetical protein